MDDDDNDDDILLKPKQKLFIDDDDEDEDNLFPTFKKNSLENSNRNKNNMNVNVNVNVSSNVKRTSNARYMTPTASSSSSSSSSSSARKSSSSSSSSTTTKKTETIINNNKLTATTKLTGQYKKQMPSNSNTLSSSASSSSSSSSVSSNKSKPATISSTSTTPSSAVKIRRVPANNNNSFSSSVTKPTAAAIARLSSSSSSSSSSINTNNNNNHNNNITTPVTVNKLSRTASSSSLSSLASSVASSKASSRASGSLSAFRSSSSSLNRPIPKFDISSSINNSNINNINSNNNNNNAFTDQYTELSLMKSRLLQWHFLHSKIDLVMKSQESHVLSSLQYIWNVTEERKSQIDELHLKLELSKQSLLIQQSIAAQSTIVPSILAIFEEYKKKYLLFAAALKETLHRIPLSDSIQPITETQLENLLQSCNNKLSHLHQLIGSNAMKNAKEIAESIQNLNSLYKSEILQLSKSTPLFKTLNEMESLERSIVLHLQTITNFNPS